METNFSFVILGFTKNSSEHRQSIDSRAHLDYSCEGVEEFSLEESRVDEILGERAYSGGDVPETLLEEVEDATFGLDSFFVKYYFLKITDAEKFVEYIKENYSDVSIHIETRPVEDWNIEWKKYYSPIKISDAFEVIPEWLFEQHKDDSKKQIVIYPGMGFGTGTHETTYLCLKLFEKYKSEISGNACLDFGCGSGILGIGAILLKEMDVDFVDIDRSALDNCLQNLKINFDVDELDGSALILRERFQEKKYNLIFANILENILVQEYPLVLAASMPGTYLIVSGLLNHQVENIIKQYKNFTMVETISKGDWSAVIFKKNA